MQSYLLQINGPVYGDRLFSTKAEAVRAFTRTWTFNGSVTLHQGAFFRAPSGFVRQHGRAFLLAREAFDDEGQPV